MKLKNYFFTVFVMFFYFALFEWGFHGLILNSLHLDAATVWGLGDDHPGRIYWITLSQLVTAFGFTFMFGRDFQDQGIGRGMYYGVIVAILLSGPVIVDYAGDRATRMLSGFWIVGMLVEFALGGLILSCICRHSSSEASPE